MKSIYTLLFLSLASAGFSQIPVLNSNPSIANKVIYLDFDGQVVSGTAWNNGNTVNAAASTASSNNIRLIWNRVSEDYRPFDVNVTTDSTRFKNANPSTRIRVVFTPTSAWYGSAGGVAYLGSFTWGGYPGTPCWVFENQLNYNAKSMAEAAAHEVGHTLSLYHQSVYNSSCTKTNEYHPGVGGGVISWCPIMGAGYTRNVTVWHNGTNANGCNIFQNDHGSSPPGISGSQFLSFLPDDIGNTFATAKILNLTTTSLVDSGLITTPTDVDIYKFDICASRYISFNVKPWALDTNSTGYAGANLDVKIKLYNSLGALIAADSSNSRLFGLTGQTLNAGTYYLGVDGGSSTNYSDYGSLGKYYVRVKSLNPPQLSNTITLPASICAGQNVTLSSVSNGTPGTWNWTVNGPVTGNFNTPNPVFNFGSSGIYTLSLLATGSSSSSCDVTRTLSVGNPFTLSLLGTQTVLCKPLNGLLTASGAQAYTWQPGGFAGNSLVVSPTVNTSYTVTGDNNGCLNSAVSTVTVGAAINLNLASTNTLLCYGSSATITASGANTYTFNPGNITSNPVIITPTFNTNYTVTGSNGICNKTSNILIKVEQPFSVSVTASDIFVCPGQTLTLIGSGAGTYTYYPGGLPGPVAVVAPTVTTIYTLSAQSVNLCPDDTTILITTIPCNMLSLSENHSYDMVKLSPQPARDFFDLGPVPEGINFEITDIQGRLIYQNKETKINGTYYQVSVAGWTRGVYFITLFSDAKKVKSLKLLIE